MARKLHRQTLPQARASGDSDCPTMNTDHTHTCCRCGHVYDCIYYDLPACKRKEVFRAAQVNRDGPYCNMCRHLEMALRFAAHRGITLTFQFRKNDHVPRRPGKGPNTHAPPSRKIPARDSKQKGIRRARPTRRQTRARRGPVRVSDNRAAGALPHKLPRKR